MQPVSHPVRLRGFGLQSGQGQAGWRGEGLQELLAGPPYCSSNPLQNSGTFVLQYSGKQSMLG